MKKLYLILLAAAAIVAGTVSCQKEEDPDPMKDYDDTVESTLTISRSSFSTDSDTARFVVKVTSDYLWYMDIPEDAQSWITPSQTYGEAGQTYKVSFHIDANSGSQDRTAVITIHSGTSKKRIDVSQEKIVRTLKESDVDASKIYIPEELRSNDFYKSNSTWYYGRSRQSEHFIVFWGRGYGDYGDVTPTECTSTKMKVDIDDLLERAEEFYDVNINQLKFAETGVGKSNLDKYKMMIFLFYQTDWLATGSGYDNTIGALWISPGTCQPVGSTIAHEIGHSFQYQVYADLGGSAGFRHSNGNGSTFWEQTAQWQSYQTYPDQAFTSYNFSVFMGGRHTNNDAEVGHCGHFLHEHQRYATYWMHWYWTDKYGIEAVGKIWRESKSPEDPLQAYQRIYGLSTEELNEDLYKHAAKCVTWDFTSKVQNGKAIGEYGKDYIGSLNWKYTTLSDGTCKVTAEMAPEATGFNHIELTGYKTGSKVSTAFTGLMNEKGYVKADASKAGWSVGYVALMQDGTTQYSEDKVIGSELTGTVEWTVPTGTKRLWMVVCATPSTYMTHLWDEDDSNDVLWPYQVKVTGAKVK